MFLFLVAGLQLLLKLSGAQSCSVCLGLMHDKRPESSLKPLHCTRLSQQHNNPPPISSLYKPPTSTMSHADENANIADNHITISESVFMPVIVDYLNHNSLGQKNKTKQKRLLTVQVQMSTQDCDMLPFTIENDLLENKSVCTALYLSLVHRVFCCNCNTRSL